MFLGTNESKQPVYVPLGKTALVGSSLFDALSGVSSLGDPLEVELPKHQAVFVGAEDDAIALLATFEEAAYYVVRFDAFDLADADALSKAYPDKSIFVLCPDYDPFALRILSKEKEMEWYREDQAWDQFVFDLVGERPVRRKKEVPLAKRPVVNNKPDDVAILGSGWKIFKRHWLNPLFSVIFMGLSAATMVGYFVFGDPENTAFQFACILMSVIFSFMPAIPMGFLFADLKCKKISDSLMMVYSLAVVLFIGFVYPLLLLSIGNANQWNQTFLPLFVGLAHLSLIWIILRILLDPFFARIFHRRNR